MDGKIADRSEEITDEEWLEVNEFNREMVQDYLDNQSDLSLQTKPAYKSGLRIFFFWVKNHLKNKDFNGMTKEWKKIQVNLKNIIPLENILKQVRQIENIYNLIKNNGNNFELSQDELEIIKKI